ncbi:TonB-dependent receptor [Dysgonomonas sp. 511]|uniref:SusC/RagA family TonB-linked outer membrane protein n=1 Tax=Dysgonomonas sp. 511 TaxID=2302930 RepID=UPI0013D84C13|nr:TonB-dependent receptor [Dysgonomonas sp. 511]NDV77375.1 TonB-dependent receptor [Dysgonomonas sp. 511]
MKKRMVFFLSCLFISIGLVMAQTTTRFNGIVVDGNGEPVISASVVVKGTTIGTVTDLDGKYSINVPEGKSTLVFTLVGMKTVEVKAVQGMTVTMADNVTELSAVEITVPYGTTQKASFTGAASVVTSDAIKDVPAVSFEKAMQGISPGISITSPSGQPGSQQSIRLRGMGSINGSNEPLYVIDGIPVVPENMSVSGVSGSAGSLGISSLIRTSDIASITILKDAAASAMYGSRGANGVIIITTKGGKSGKTRVSLKASVGFNDWAVTSRKVLNGDQFRDVMKDSWYNKQIDGGASHEDAMASAQARIDAFYPIPEGGYSDWEDALFKSTGTIQNYEASIEGGNDKTKFFASLGALDESGKAENSWIKQYTGRLNLSHETDNLKMGANISIAQVKKNRVAEGGAYANPYYATRNYLAPTTPIYNADGTFYEGTMLGGLANPVKSLNTDKYLLDVFSARASFWAQYKIYDNLQFKQTLSYDYNNVRSTTVWSKDGRNGANAGGLTIKMTPESRKLYSSSILSYDKTFKDVHNFDVLIGWDVEKRVEDMIQAVGQGYASSQVYELAGAATPTGAYSVKDNDRILSVLSRLNYNYDNKYYASASLRRDGSTRFGENNRWGTFWSLSGAWRVSAEKFMSSLTFIDDLKLRTSYGETGNLPSTYYSSQNTYYVTASYMGSPGTYPARIFNPDLKWEKFNTLDFGLEARLFNRLSFELDLYNKKSKDLIATVPVSHTTGFVNYVANLGEMSNKGIEISIGVDVVNNKDFFWHTKLNLAHNSNKVTKVYGDQEIKSRDGLPFITKTGESYYSFYTREYAGVNPETGAEQWYTNKLKDDGTLSRDITENPALAERVLIDKADPDLTGGWSNTFSYKGFELSALVSFSLGGRFYDEGWIRDTNGMYDFNYSYMPSIGQYENRWRKSGDTGVGRRITGYAYGNYSSSKWIHSSTHARLKNISLSYTLPTHVVKKINLGSVRFIVNATNLLTLRKTADFDPEVPSDYIVGYALPPLKDVTFGVELSF